MENEIILIQHKYDVLMDSLFKILKIKLRLCSRLISFEKTILQNLNPEAKLIIFDQTIFEKNNFETINEYLEFFPNAKMLIVSLEDNYILNKYIFISSRVEVVNFWNPSFSTTKFLKKFVDDIMNSTVNK
jgi:hypothetical protein